MAVRIHLRPPAHLFSPPNLFEVLAKDFLGEAFAADDNPFLGALYETLADTFREEWLNRFRQPMVPSTVRFIQPGLATMPPIATAKDAPPATRLPKLTQRKRIWFGDYDGTSD